MNLSDRLKTISEMIDNNTKTIVDVGTDHGYIPIYLVKNKKINYAIASDINKGPVEKAKLNIKNYNLENMINCRLGGGLTTIKKNEVEVAIIAGMGGNLIRDIIENSLDIFKKLDYVILQPVQNPEVLKEYIYSKGYDILDEELVKEDGKFYEIFKIRYNNNIKEIENIYYEISEILLKKKHPVMKEYLNFKLEKYIKICDGLKLNSEGSISRKKELEFKVSKIKEFLECL